jgi:hypothetical protein
VTDERASPELRALAGQLFAAGRAERPDPALARRLSMIEPGALAQSTTQRHDKSEQRRGTRRLRSAGALAAVLAAAGVWLWLTAETPSLIVMSPDPARGAAPTAVVEHFQEPAVAQTTTSVPTEAAIAPSRAIKRAARAPATPERTAQRPNPPEVARAPSASDVQPAEQAKPLTLLDELGLLKRARTALRAGDAAKALALLDRHAREGSGNGLGAEAALLRIEALAALGQRTEASELAARFVRENPNSALGDRARSFITPTPAVIKHSPAGHEDAKGAD